MGQLFGKIHNKDCCCGGVCCPARCNTVNDETCDNPLPLTMTCTLTVSTVKNDPITGLPSGCYSVTGTLSLSPFGWWVGPVTGTCSGWCGATERIFDYDVRVECGVNPDDSITWFISVTDNITGDPARVCVAPFSDPPVWAALESTCDPILLIGETTSFFCGDLACVIPGLGIDEAFGDVVLSVMVTEDP